MKGRVIALGHVNEFEAAALIEDGRVNDFLVDCDQPRPGTIYRAIVDRPMKGQGGVFVKTPDGPGFLRNVKGLSSGGPILVQVTGYAEPGKALPLTTRLLFKSRHAIVTPDAPGINVSRSIRDDDLRDSLLVLAREIMGDCPMGLILRSSCQGAQETDIEEDISLMVNLAQAVTGDAEGREPEKLTEGDGPHALAWRDWPAPDQLADDARAFETFGVLDTLDALRDPFVPSGDGGLFIEPTRALVAVDINTGGDTSPAAGLKANLAAARALPRQLRLRGLGGQITLDLAPMAKKARRTFESALRAAFRQDTVETTLVGWTPIGHYELQRKRDRIALASVLP